MPGKTTKSGKYVPSSIAMYTSGFGERLAEVIDSVGSLVMAATAAGVTGEQVARWRDGAARPNAFNLAALAMSAGYSVDWLITGRGYKQPQFPVPDEKLVDGKLVYKEPIPSDFRLIPRLDVQAAAGAGALVEHENHREMVAFRADWLRRRGINPLFANVLTARGDSMEPTIRDGDILLGDTSIDSVIDNAIYVVVFDGRTLVKRVQLRRDGSVVLKSDNKDIFDDEAVPAAEVHSLNVAGRVMWYGRSI